MSLADTAVDVNRLLGATAETIGKLRYCWLLTEAGEGGIRPRPMGRVPRDAGEDEWTLRFLTDGRSPKAADMRRVCRVSVIFHDEADDAYVALAGKASLAEGKPEIRRRWTPAYDVYFPDGPPRTRPERTKRRARRARMNSGHWMRGHRFAGQTTGDRGIDGLWGS